MPETEKPLGYILWWPVQRRYYFYCTHCANIDRRNSWQPSGKTYPVYEDHLGVFNQRCKDCLRWLKSSSDLELFDEEFLKLAGSPEIFLNAQR